jgi:Icc-related predicted phosphoesterase
MSKTRFIIISDTHNQHAGLAAKTAARRMPAGDVLIYCGDFTGRGKPEEVEAFNTWLAEQDYKYKVGTCGNHDFLFEKDRDRAMQLFTAGEMLIDREFILPLEGTEETLKIWGSPWNPWFHDWAFNSPEKPLAKRRFMQEKWKAIPEDVDILITHTPPFQILDHVNNRHGEADVGCFALRERQEEICFSTHFKQRLNCFGHIHEGRGVVQSVATGWLYVNASNCLWNLHYPPFVVDYDHEARNYSVVEDEADW